MHSKPWVVSVSSISIIKSSTVRHWVSYNRSEVPQDLFHNTCGGNFAKIQSPSFGYNLSTEFIGATLCELLRTISNIPREILTKLWWKLRKLLSRRRGVDISGASPHFIHLSPAEFEFSDNGNCMRAMAGEPPPKSVRECRYKSFHRTCIFWGWDFKENILAALRDEKSVAPISKIFTELLHILMFLARRIGECWKPYEKSKRMLEGR